MPEANAAQSCAPSPRPSNTSPSTPARPSRTSATPAAPTSPSAHQLISEDERLLPPARDKTRSLFLAYRAASHLNLKEPEPAAAAATKSLLLARRIGAPRCVRLVMCSAKHGLT
ncbi:hypothetical protein OG331_05760 [Streptomyces sp. NBC_01017]|uniref:hypothetical protein n=1 Tax=Streptomyces sp. NBC_01017 TaxID=2903721 RepID=UPI00386CF170|nr:hypothetical protein OG331_05760 [Streptomyces sp. NBC_01017]